MLRHLRFDVTDRHIARGQQMFVVLMPRYRLDNASLFCYSPACALDERRNYSIMRTPFFHADHLREFLRGKTIATLPELKQALGTTVDTTVFRKLKELSYRSSYSHRGRYYTLAEIPQFEPQGLWSFQAIWFSRWGTLVSTVETLVNSERTRRIERTT